MITHQYHQNKHKHKLFRIILHVVKIPYSWKKKIIYARTPTKQLIKHKPI